MSLVLVRLDDANTAEAIQERRLLVMTPYQTSNNPAAVPAPDAPVEAPARPEAPSPTPPAPASEGVPLKPLLERPFAGELPDLTEVD